MRRATAPWIGIGVAAMLVLGTRNPRSRADYLSWRSFARSAITSISVIRPSATTKPTTATGVSCGTTITPALPLTIAGRA